MKNWLEKNYKTLIIAAFLVPIITVAIVSISHVTKWYGISNPVSWSIYLSIGIEIAALSALAAISANMGKKVYFPFAIVTLVQFIGNIYFAYSYIDINAQSFKDWVGLVSPFVEFMGVDPTDFVGHKRFLAFFAGGMLPIISLSFLHMLVKFTEEDRMNQTEKGIDIKIQENVPSADVEDENNRLKLSQNDLEILEKHLMNPNPPNEALIKAAQRYSDEVREKHTHINDFEETSVKSELTPEERGEILAEMMKNDQELGLYDESFDDPLINPETTSTLNVPEMMLPTNQEIIESIPSDDEFSDWDVTLMDGLEDEPSFFTDEEIEKILQGEPTSEEESENFSTITPETENIFQEEYVPSLSDEEIMEMNQDEYERNLDMEDEFDGFVPEPFATPEEVQKYNLEESVKEYFDEKPEDPAIEILEDQLYEESEESEDDDIKKKF
jgi:hypothetical protein